MLPAGSRQDVARPAALGTAFRGEESSPESGVGIISGPAAWSAGRRNHFFAAFQASKAFWVSVATLSGVEVPRPIAMRPLLITL